MRARLVGIALTVGLYTLALAVVAGLVATAAWALVGHHTGFVPFLALSAAWTIVKSIWPSELFGDGPGVPVSRAEAPALHALVHDVASAAGVAPPDEVRLDLDANAGALHWRGRRVLILGLPYVAAQGREELRAVVAHELAHLRPEMAKTTRITLRARTVFLRLEFADGLGLVRAPFRWYARLFIQVTNALSREEERFADAFSARVVGEAAAARSLAMGHCAGEAWVDFWCGTAREQLARGVRPHLAEGFRAAVIAAELRVAPEGPPAEAPSTHPSLQERLAAVHHDAVDVRLGGDPALIAEVARHERALLAIVGGEEAVAGLRDAEPVETAAVGGAHGLAGRPDAEDRVVGPPLSGPDRNRETGAPVARGALAPRGLGGAYFTAPLASGSGARRKAIVMLAAIAVPCLLFAAIFASLAATPDAPTAAARPLALGLAAVCVLVALFFGRRYANVFRPDGSLIADSRRLVVVQPQVLEEPLVVPLERVRIVAVDPTEGDARFPMFPDTPWTAPLAGGDRPVGCMWTEHDGPRVPMLEAAARTPNVVVLLDEPVELPPTRRRFLTLPRGGTPIGAFMLRVEDPVALAETLDRAGLLRPLREADFEPAEDASALPESRGEVAVGSVEDEEPLAAEPVRGEREERLPVGLLVEGTSPVERHVGSEPASAVDESGDVEEALRPREEADPRLADLEDGLERAAEDAAGHPRPQSAASTSFAARSPERTAPSR